MEAQGLKQGDEKIQEYLHDIYITKNRNLYLDCISHWYNVNVKQYFWRSSLA